MTLLVTIFFASLRLCGYNLNLNLLQDNVYNSPVTEICSNSSRSTIISQA